MFNTMLLFCLKKKKITEKYLLATKATAFACLWQPRMFCDILVETESLKPEHPVTTDCPGPLSEGGRNKVWGCFCDTTYRQIRANLARYCCYVRSSLVDVD